MVESKDKEEKRTHREMYKMEEEVSLVVAKTKTSFKRLCVELENKGRIKMYTNKALERRTRGASAPRIRTTKYVWTRHSLDGGDSYIYTNSGTKRQD